MVSMCAHNTCAVCKHHGKDGLRQQVGSKRLLGPAPDNERDTVRRKLFDDSDNESRSTAASSGEFRANAAHASRELQNVCLRSRSFGCAGASKRPDEADTQAWNPEPENYVNAWLESARAEHAAAVAAARSGKAGQRDEFEDEVSVGSGKDHDARAQSLKDRLRKREQLDLEGTDDIGKPAARQNYH